MRQAFIDAFQHHWLCQHVIAGKTLNVGCGKHPYPGAVNIDPNPGRQPVPDYAYDVHDLPWGDQHFEVVLSNHVLPALCDIDKAMCEMIRVLKPGGHMAHVVPNWAVTPKRLGSKFPWERQHQGWHSAEELRAFFEQYPRLEVEVCEPFPRFDWSFRVVAFRRWEARCPSANTLNRPQT